MGFCEIHLRVILQKVHQKWNLEINLNITQFKLQQHPSYIQVESAIKWIVFFGSLSPSNQYQCINLWGAMESDICSS